LSDVPGEVTGGTGAGDGGPGLSLPEDQSALTEPDVSGYPGASELGGGGMPMMPMGGMGSGGGLGGVGSEGAPSDASGLLGGDAAPWSGSPSLPDASGEVTGGAGQGGPGLSLPQNQLDADGVPVSGTGEAGLAESGMPMMPMGGVGAGAGSGEGEHQRSDASGLLLGASEPWSAAAVGEGTEIGSAHGAPHAEGYLQLPSAYGLSENLYPQRSAEAELSGQGPSAFSAAQEFAAGVLGGMPFAASAGNAGAGAGEEAAPNHNHAPQAANSAWGEPGWGTAEFLYPAPAPAEGGHQSARDGQKAARQPTLEERAAPQAQEEAGTAHEPAEHREEPGTHGLHQPPEPEPEPVHEAPAEEPVGEAEFPEAAGADDASTWDSAPGLLLPLFGVRGPGVHGDQGASTEADRQDAAAVTTVAAGAFAIAHAIGGNQTLDEPVRPAWRPKASGSVPMELTCALDEPEEEESDAQQPESENSPAAATKGNGKGKGRGKGPEEEEQTSVADLLRQGEEAWGGVRGAAELFR
jgi:hypothetical protein